MPNKDSGEDVINARGSLPVANNMSPKGRAIICLFLTEEIRVYTELLNRAVNLSDENIRLALERVQKNCPYVFESLLLNNDSK